MNKEQIKTVLPHREPMLLIDEILPQEDGSVLGHYTVPQDAFFCQGHFPGNPIVPGVILCEIMAQTCCMLFPSVFENGIVVYRGLDAVRFRAEVHPGDRCDIRCRLIDKKGSIFLCETTLSVDGKKCCQGKLTLAVISKQ